MKVLVAIAVFAAFILVAPAITLSLHITSFALCFLIGGVCGATGGVISARILTS